MNTTDLIELANRYFLADDGLGTSNLIRRIQVAQGNIGCFATGKHTCEQTVCPWLDDCLPQSEAPKKTNT